MTIGIPKQPGDYPDRALDCVRALEPAFLQIAWLLRRTGKSDLEAAEMLLDAMTGPHACDYIADDLERIVVWAVHAGWREGEARRTVERLVHANAAGASADAETLRQIRNATGLGIRRK